MGRFYPLQLKVHLQQQVFEARVVADGDPVLHYIKENEPTVTLIVRPHRQKDIALFTVHSCTGQDDGS